MTQFRIYATDSKVGRKKEFPDRITLPLAEGVIERIDRILQNDEARLDMIRSAVERELKRREREFHNSKPD